MTDYQKLTVQFFADWLVLFILLIPFVFVISKKYAAASHALFSSAFCWFVSELIKNLFFTPRPFIGSGSLPLSGILMDGSFPSGHTASSFAVAFALTYHSPHLGVVLLVLSLFIGLSRIVSGIHYPVDILGGIMLAFSTAYVASRIKFFRPIPLLKKRVFRH